MSWLEIGVTGAAVIGGTWAMWKLIIEVAITDEPGINEPSGGVPNRTAEPTPNERPRCPHCLSRVTRINERQGPSGVYLIGECLACTKAFPIGDLR